MLSWHGCDSSSVQKISCGGNHTLLLLQDGSLYGCGDNSQYQLGSAEESWVGWHAIEGSYLDVTCGWEFTAMINHNGDLLTRGRGLKGELGRRNTRLAEVPIKVMDVRIGSKLFSSFQNCVVVEPTACGGCRVLGWGSNTKCQLQQPKCRIIDHPVVLYQSESILVDYAAMGKDFIVLVDKQRHMVHASGLLPSGFCLQDWGGKPVHVCCMWSSLHVWPGRGESAIFSYGNGNHGQLFRVPQNHLEVEDFATGSEHGILVAAGGDGGVLCWGWGEHGNCGQTGESATLSVPGVGNITKTLNTVFTRRDIESTGTRATPKVYGGCASTWIVT